MNDVRKITLFFTKEYPANFLSYKDYLRHIIYALRRSEVKLMFSQGFHPRPLVYTVSSLALGVTSLVEPISVEVAGFPPDTDQLNKVLPNGISYLGFIDEYVKSYTGVYRYKNTYFLIKHPVGSLKKFIETKNIPPYGIIKEDIIVENKGAVRCYLGVNVDGNKY